MKLQKLERSLSKDVVGQDRLSELPDDLIVHILSFLPTADAVRTMLIRRFGDLWTSVPTLAFDVQEFLNEMFPYGCIQSNEVQLFYSFAQNVVTLHKRPVIDKFHLCLEEGFLGYNNGRESMEVEAVGKALRLALDNQVKEMKFCDVCSELSNYSDFPKFISESLVTLHLCHCYIDRQFEVSLGSLKKLVLRYVNMTEEALEHLLSGCPSLQELIIDNPREITYLRFSAPNIHTLSLILPQEDETDDPWLFDFPNIEYLDLETDWIPVVVDVSSVRDVHLKRFSYDMDDEDQRGRFKVLLRKLACAEVFRISHCGSEVFLHSIYYLDPLQNRWKRVIFELKVFCQSCLLGLYQLMRSSEQLEELIIRTIPNLTRKRKSLCNSTPGLIPRQGFEANTDSPSVQIPYPCVMPKLKTVTLHGYVKPWKHHLELIEFVLRNATVLDKLVINLNNRGLTSVEKLEFVKHVSSFPRSSPSAKVVVFD